MSLTPSSGQRLQCADRTLDLSTPIIMGVVNTTPDSFSDGGTLYRNSALDLNLALERARTMVLDGAMVLDIGGESTRPGAEPVSAEQEAERVMPLVEAIRSELDVVISVDTSTPSLMLAAANAGAGLINDVRALQRPGALEAAATSGLPVCLMHMQGEPQTMQAAPHYDNTVDEVKAFWEQRVAACSAVGIPAERLLLDPGFGFGKTVSHNLQLLERLTQLCELGHPIVVGLSRKSLIGKLIGREVDERLPASLALAVMAVERGAAIVRTHDVRETADALAMVAAVRNLGVK